MFVVRKGAKIAAPEDLRGRVLAYNDDESLSGYHIAKFWLVARGETGAFFSSTLASVSDTVFFGGALRLPLTHTCTPCRCCLQGGHELSARLVASGAADVCAVDIVVWKRLCRTKPALVAQLACLDSPAFRLPVVPIQPFVVAKRLPADVKARLRTALVGLQHHVLQTARAAAAAGGEGGGGHGAADVSSDAAQGDGAGDSSSSSSVDGSDGDGDDGDVLTPLTVEKFVVPSDNWYDSLRGLLKASEGVTLPPPSPSVALPTTTVEPTPAESTTAEPTAAPAATATACSPSPTQQ